MATITEKIAQLESQEVGTVIAGIFSWVRYNEIRIKDKTIVVYTSLFYLIVWFLSYRMKKSTVKCCTILGLKEVRVKWNYFLEQ